MPTTRHARHFGGEGVELVHHDVHGFLQLKLISLPDTFTVIFTSPLRHRCGSHFGDVVDLAGEVEAIEFVLSSVVLPCAGHAAHHRLTAELAFGTHLARHTGHFEAKALSWSTVVLMVSLS